MGDAVVSSPPASAKRTRGRRAKKVPGDAEMQMQATPQKGSRGKASADATSPGQTPVKSPPTKKGRGSEESPEAEAPEVIPFESQPTLRLEDAHMLDVPSSAEAAELMQDAQTLPGVLEPGDTVPVAVKPHVWMRSKPFAEMVQYVLLDSDFDGDLNSVPGMGMWPNAVPKSPMTWVLAWKESDFAVPFPFKIDADDTIANDTLNMLASVARDRMIQAMSLVKQARVLETRLSKSYELTDRLEQQKLKKLEDSGMKANDLNVARKTLAEWAGKQKAIHKQDFDNATAQGVKDVLDTVDQVVDMLVHMMESHDLVVPFKPVVDNSLLKELEMELDSAMQDVVAATPLDSPESPTAHKVDQEISAGQPTPMASPMATRREDAVPAAPTPVEPALPPNSTPGELALASTAGANAVTRCLFIDIYV